MRIDKTFLKSKVAHRIFVLFIFCALVPISILSIISFTQVTRELEKQSRLRLRRSSKGIGVNIMERLFFLENELYVFSSGLDATAGSVMVNQAKINEARLRERFKAMALVTHSGALTPVFGEIQAPAPLSDAEREHLLSGRSILSTRGDEQGQLHAYMMLLLDRQNPQKGFLFAEINTMYLWGLTETDSLPGQTELCVLDESGDVIFSSHPVSDSFHEILAKSMSRGFAEQFEWEYNHEEYLACIWSVFLKYQFFEPNWIVVTSTSKKDIFSPLSSFKQIFPPVILLSLLVVVLLSVIQIRKTMNPLERLKDATQRIAQKDFQTRVTVTSGDEFEELGSSFNNMARQLGRQFTALTTMADIDRAILSSLDTKKIIDTVMDNMPKIFSYDLVCVFLFESQGNDRYTARMYTSHTSSSLLDSEVMAIDHKEIQRLMDDREKLLLKKKEEFPPYLASFTKIGIGSAILLPLFVKKRLEGIIALGTFESHEPNEEDLLHARQLADQVAVALSNAKLIEELDSLNWGTLKALARTVDAKSPWTAGHSERVTELAMKIGKVMGLTQQELESLHRGGLLHDIGKIGVPAAILDKPGKLTDEEFAVIKQHPLTGARILEPIAAYADIIPIGLQHHERFNGKGYPYGISGEEICLGARILSVADVYDALISDRPYRVGMGPERTLAIIKEGSGTQFDRRVVDALLKLLGQKEKVQIADMKEVVHPMHSHPEERGAMTPLKSL